MPEQSEEKTQERDVIEQLRGKYKAFDEASLKALNRGMDELGEHFAARADEVHEEAQRRMERERGGST